MEEATERKAADQLQQQKGGKIKGRKNNKRRRSFTIKSRLIVSFIVILLLPSLLISISSYLTAKNKVDEQMINAANESVRLLNQIFSEFIVTKKKDADLLAQLLNTSDIKATPQNKLGDSSEVRKHLDLYTSLHLEVEQAFVGTSKGLFINSPSSYRNADDFDPRETPWYQLAMEKRGEIVITSPYLSPSSNELVITIAKATSNGQGVVGLNVNINGLADIAESVNIGREGYVYILDDNYHFILHPTREVGTEAPKNVQNDNLYKSESGYFEYLHDGVDPKKMFFTTNPETGWKLAGTMYSEEVDQEASEIQTRTMIILVGVIAVGAVIIYLMIISITGPLKRLTEAAHKISQGDLREKVEVRSEDEIGQLATSFNQMADSLQEVLAQVTDSSNQLSSSSEELSASAEQNNQASEQVSIRVQRVATGAEQQLLSVEQTAHSVAKVEERVAHITANAQSVTQAVNASATKAAEGNVAIQSAIKQMNAINSTVDQLSKASAGLGEQSSAIGNIIGVITDISNQTNLLALNAAIEAARAGEQGRGFAVVADEVRKLAEQSTEAAQQIAQKIQSIQEETSTTASAMQNVTQEIKEGIQTVHAAGASFEHIIAAINEVVAQIKEVSTAAVEMSSSTHDVVTAMESVSEISATSAQGLQEVAGLTQEQLASMEEITASASALSKMAEDLQRIMERFKI